MTDVQLQDALREWVDRVLNVEEGLNASIIFGSQNAPRPVPPYFVIHQPINTRKIGDASQGYANASGDTDIVSNYEASVTFEVVEGQTDWLRLVLDSVEKQSIKDCLRSKNISFMRSENIINTSDMTENKWTLRMSVDVFILYPHESTENTSYIGDIDLTNNII